MNVNSPLIKEVLTLQQSFDAIHINEFMTNKLLELRPKYFSLANFKSAFVR